MVQVSAVWVASPVTYGYCVLVLWSYRLTMASFWVVMESFVVVWRTVLAVEVWLWSFSSMCRMVFGTL